MTDSLDVYEDTLSHIRRSGSVRAERNVDSLAINREKSESAFAELARRIDAIIDPAVPILQLVQVVRASQLPPAFLNLLCVMTAEGIRRRGDLEQEMAVMERCTNPVLQQLWNRWSGRVSTSLLEARS
jgi:hypothetical protein